VDPLDTIDDFFAEQALRPHQQNHQRQNI
jgi:hypothetical protein